MTYTLKQVYQHKKILETKNKVVAAQLAMLEKKEVEALINEAIEENIDDVQAVIEKLRSFEDIIKSDPSKNAAEMTKILQDQMDEINAAIAKDKEGGVIGLFQRLLPEKNPVNKALAFIAALEAGFKVLPTIVKNNLKSASDPKNKEKSIDELTTGEDEKLQKAGDIIRKSFQKAFITKGKLASLKFDANKAGLSDFIFGLTTLKLETLNNLAKQINAGPQASVAADAADVTEPASEEASSKEDKGGKGVGPFDKIRDKIGAAKSFDELINSVKTLGAGTKIKLGSGQEIEVKKLLDSLEKIKNDPDPKNYDERKLKIEMGITNAGGLRDKVFQLLRGAKPAGKDAGPGQPIVDKQQRQQIVALTSDVAKKAGITDGDSVQALMDKLDFKIGSLEGALVVPQLQKLQRKFNIPEEQTDGFIRGLMLDFEADFKNELQNSITKEIERIKKEREEKKKKGEKNVSIDNELKSVMGT